MKAILAAVAAFATALTATPAAAQLAQTYNSFNTFNGAQGAGNFTYGTANPLTGEATLFAPTTTCFTQNAVSCLQGAPVAGQTPFFSKSVSPIEQGSILVPDDRLLTHSAGDGLVTFITFTAPRDGYYDVMSNFQVQHKNPTDVGIYLILNNWNSPDFSLQKTITAIEPFYQFMAGFDLKAGDIIGFGMGPAGPGTNDFTGVNFILTSNVPEPTTWALLIVGIGLVGWSLRRRSPLAVA